MHMERPKHSITLADIKQREDETLKSYLDRFNAAAVGVGKPDPTFIHMVVVKGLRKNTAFHTSLTKTKSKDLRDFYRRAEKYLRLEASLAEGSGNGGVREELQRINAEERNDHPNEQGKRKAADDKSQGQSGRKKFRPGKSRFTTYTDLMDTVENVFLGTQNVLPYKRPPRGRKPKRICNLGSSVGSIARGDMTLMNADI